MSRIRKTLLSVSLLMTGVVIGRMTDDSTLTAEVRRTTPRAAFESGAERSETVLKEMAVTLKTIDQRIARIEGHVAENAKTSNQ